MSSITKPRLAGESLLLLGAEIRRRRSALGLSQTELGQPFTRGFVSAVENGRCAPSLPALLLLAQRLDMTGAELLEAVNPRLRRGYTIEHATGQSARSTDAR